MSVDVMPAEEMAASFAPDVARTLDRMAKRALDVTFALTLLLLLLPLIAVVGLLVRLDSRGPAFHRCRRVGFGGNEFPMLKFRKMAWDAAGPPLSASDDARFTRIGRFLAGSRLDEIPQLWNVVRGDMSLVGPRPEDPSFVALDEGAFKYVLRVKPGITGLSQLAFAKEAEILDPDDRMGHYVRQILPQKLGIDRLYAQSRSVLMDLRVLAWTFAVVLLRRDVAVHRNTGALNLRRRPGGAEQS